MPEDEKNAIEPAIDELIPREPEQEQDEIVLDPSFKYEVANTPGGEHIQRCFACGTCSASCPVQEINKDYNPRKIIRMILLGMRKEVLSADFIWLCANCNHCYEHCPQDVRYSDISHAIKKIALKEAEDGKIQITRRKPQFDQFFVENLLAHGRLYEMGLMSRFMANNPDLKEVLAYVPTGISMIKTGKLKFLPTNIDNIDQIREAFLSAMDEDEDIKLNVLPHKMTGLKDVESVLKYLVKEGKSLKDQLLPINFANVLDAANEINKELLRFAAFVMDEEDREDNEQEAH